MSSHAILLLGSYFNEEVVDLRPEVRDGLRDDGPEAFDRIRGEVRELIRERRLTPLEFRNETGVRFANEEQMYSEFEGAYRYFFEGGEDGAS
ncbi:hypothetical protein Q0Z83_078170 [Actinoplanes sichuanensis]|uniref:CdiI immunity protein domain-containing protein n=1 Tax=Actinoplanes sichuanensis TaxID=512349 RepID=A0ABW4ADM4_9ACTN|nr:hypothetical protein [Actinoplanes sichuanensis]BEL09626.1 hypothetical protein Q0Z83_078170 [Actinoplanes sichuanensis]